MPELEVRLPPLHKGRDYKDKPGLGGQDAIARHPARFKVVMCGRRWGKTTEGAWVCMDTGIKGGRAWWVAPSYKIANEGWRIVKLMAFQLKVYWPDIDIREGDRAVVFPNGGIVEVRSADNEGALRGAGLDGVVLDECADIAEDRWTQELRPALSDRKGWALFIGTPQGDNWFTKLYDRAEKLDGWERWHLWSENNPFLDPAEIESARLDMTDDEWEQEYHANIGASKFLVYGQFDRQLHKWTEELPRFVQLVGGLDFGGTAIGSHKSAGLLAGRTDTDLLILLEEFEQSGPNIAERQVEWMDTCRRAAAELSKRGMGPKDIIWAADKTQMFGIQLMRQAGYPVIASKGGVDSVINGVTLVQRRLQLRENGAKLYYLPHLHFFPDAMERYRYPEPDDLENKQQATKPMKVRDDLVDALRYLVERADLLALGDPAVLYRNALAVVR